ncbi:hypothetical protein D3C72_1408120 [compost metagenome]
MVGGKRQHQASGLAALGKHGGGGHRGGAVAAGGLKHHRCRQIDLFRLAPSEETEILVGDHQRFGIKALVAHPLQRLLIGRKIADQRLELLGQLIARYRPKPGTSTAGKKNRRDLSRLFLHNKTFPTLKISRRAGQYTYFEMPPSSVHGRISASS